MVLSQQNLIPGRPLTAVKAYYTLDGRGLSDAVQISVLSMANGAVTSRIDPVDRWGVPGQRFGMVTYDTSYSWRNATITYR
jgi:hypothetical protein